MRMRRLGKRDPGTAYLTIDNGMMEHLFPGWFLRCSVGRGVCGIIYYHLVVYSEGNGGAGI